MKLTSLQLEQQLKQGRLSRVYVLCGEEPFLIQESFSLLRRTAQASDFKDRLRLDIETDADLQNAYTHAYTPPLLSPKRLLEFHWKAKLSKAGQQFLIAYAQQPSPQALVAVRLGKLDGKTEQTQWFKTLEKNSTVVTHWPLAPKQLPSWLIARARAEKLELSLAAAELLARAVAGNLSAAAQEIEKLSLLGITPIEPSLIEALVVDQGCFNAFDLVDHALCGKPTEALRILGYLQQEGTEPLLIIGAFMHELRTLTKMAKALETDNSLAPLLAQYRIRPSRQNAIRNFLKRHSEPSCFRLILKAGELDRLAKGALAGSVWESLASFSVAVATAGIGYKYGI